MTDTTPDTDNPFDNPDFKAGVDVGHDLGRYEAEEEAHKAFAMGEIELWLNHYTPRTSEEWDAYDAEHGKDFADRWKPQRDTE